MLSVQYRFIWWGWSDGCYLRLCHEVGVWRVELPGEGLYHVYIQGGHRDSENILCYENICHHHYLLFAMVFAIIHLLHNIKDFYRFQQLIASLNISSCH